MNIPNRGPLIYVTLFATATRKLLKFFVLPAKEVSTFSAYDKIEAI